MPTISEPTVRPLSLPQPSPLQLRAHLRAACLDLRDRGIRPTEANLIAFLTDQGIAPTIAACIAALTDPEGEQQERAAA